MIVDDGAASQQLECVVDSSGTKRWYFVGNRGKQFLHREDGPAVEYFDGAVEWWLNGKLHREDGPAIVSWNGSNFWYRDGLMHREDGPAAEYADGSVEWYLDGKKMSEEEFNQRVCCRPTSGEVEERVDAPDLVGEIFDVLMNPPDFVRWFVHNSKLHLEAGDVIVNISDGYVVDEFVDGDEVSVDISFTQKISY